jgi:hypothetical protein
LFVDAYNFTYQPRPGFDGVHIDEGYGAFVINSRTLLIVTQKGEGLILPSSSNATHLTGVIEYTMDRVPVFLFYDNPEQFEIICLSRHQGTGMTKEFVEAYFKSGQTGQISEGHPDLTFYDSDGWPSIPYRRIIIQHRKPAK